jgi:KaiC/GvpD/RAD55 family RecA-like ATPase
MSDVNVEDYLTGKGWQFKRSGYELHGACFFCGEDPHKRGRLYVNVEDSSDGPSGKFMCHLCGTKGNLITIMKHFGDKFETPKDTDDSYGSYAVSNVWNAATLYYQNALKGRPDVVDWLREKRGLSDETIERFKLGWAGGGLRLHLLQSGHRLEDMQKTGLVDAQGRDFLIAHVTIPYEVGGDTVQIRGKDMGGKYMSPRGGKVRMFNVNSSWGTEECFITEGEFDCILLEQLGFKSVGVPGAQTWQQSWSAQFTDLKRVYVCFDNDAAGITGREKVLTALGSKAKVVTLPVGVDVTDYFVTEKHSKEDFESLVRVGTLGLLRTVEDAYKEWLEASTASGINLGWGRFDKALGKGFMEAQLMVLLAKTGTGKTIWLINTFQRLAMVNPDAKILFVSLEQTADEWFERACRIYRFYNPEAGNEDAVDYWKDRIMIVDRNSVKEVELEETIDNYVTNFGCKPDVIGVDYLGYWARGFRGEAYERTTAAIMSLKRIAKDYRVRIIAPHQVGRSGRSGEELASDMARDSGSVEETADFVMGLWRPDNKAGNAQQPNDWIVNVDLLKSRHGNGGVRLVYRLAPYSLALVPFDLAAPACDIGKDVYKNQYLYHERIASEIEWNEDNKTDLSNSFDGVIERHREKVLKHKQLVSKVGLYE